MADDAQIVAIIKSVGRFAEKEITKLTLDITANLIEVTPVDTGWARANWVPQITTAFEGMNIDHNSRKERLANVDLMVETQSKGLGDVLAYKLEEGMVHIANNVPYIEKLNEGYSKQAPSAFVQQSIARAVDLVQGGTNL